MTDVDAAFMHGALLLGAAALESREVPVGCVFVAGSRVLARAHNATNATYDATRHAEMVALDAIVSLVRGDEALSARPLLERVQGFLADATVFVTVEPCIMCAAALRRAGVGRVVYGCGNDKFGGAGTVLDILRGGAAAGAPAAPCVTAGVCRDEAVALLKRFYARANPVAPSPKQTRTMMAAPPAAAGPGDHAAFDKASIDAALSAACALAVLTNTS